MSLIVRLFLVIFAAFFKKPLGPLEGSVLKLHVLPTDLDILFHMNNGRFLTLMDLGRIDIIMRTGFWKVVMKEKLCPLVGIVNIEFNRSLKLGESFELHSRIVCWDEKWFYMEQYFEDRGKIIASAWMKGLFRGPKGNISSSKIVEMSGHQVTSPDMPDDLSQWAKSA